MTAGSPVPEELFAHSTFVRRLARSLLRDAHDADDLEQETWRVTLERPPGSRGNLRGWLTRVTQNLARRSRRGARRRNEHERLGSRAALISDEAPLEQQEVLNRVVEAVGALDEPYRTVILMRFYEDLPPRAIAARLGIPLQTVHTRSKRALRLLQARLERGRSDWRSGLVLLVGTGPHAAPVREALPRQPLLRSTIAASMLLLGGFCAWLAVSSGARPVWRPDVGRTTSAGGRPSNPSTSTLQQREPMSSPNVLAAAVVASALPILGPAQDHGTTQLMSVGFDAACDRAVGNGDSRAGCISANGRYVAFSSTADNLLCPPDLDQNAVADVFVRDRWTEQTFLVSAPPGFPDIQANGASANPSITPDGAYLVFDSLASNLDPDSSDTNGVGDIFRISLASLPSLPPAELVSLSDVELPSNGHSYAPDVSDDGVLVAFSSVASNLTSNSPNGPGIDIYVRDMVLGTTLMVSVNNQGIPADRNLSEDQVISGNGRYVAFWSNADNLDPNDTNDAFDVFVFDLQGLEGSRLALVSKASTGVSGNAMSLHPCISQDGGYISFMSLANDLVSHDTNTGPDVFVRNMWTGQNVLVNRGPDGAVVSEPGVVDNGTMTGNGRFLTFYGGGMQYGPDTNGHWDVFLIDRDRDGNGVFDEPGRTQTRRVSIGPNREEGDGESVAAALMATISRTGDFVVFESLASTFTGSLPDASGENANYDVFVRDLRKILPR